MQQVGNGDLLLFRMQRQCYRSHRNYRFRILDRHPAQTISITSSQDTRGKFKAIELIQGTYCRFSLLKRLRFPASIFQGLFRSSHGVLSEKSHFAFVLVEKCQYTPPIRNSNKEYTPLDSTTPPPSTRHPCDCPWVRQRQSDKGFP